jgi:outer membrane receptor protein involved in Fe transport
MRMQYIFGVCLFFVGATGATADAQPRPESFSRLETVIVRGERLADPPSLALQSAVTVEAAELQRYPGLALDDVLRAQAGFQLFRRGPSEFANPTTQGATLRSLGGNAAGRALVTLDGVPQDDPFGGWVAWRTLDLDALDRATLVRGGGAGAFGAGVLAGVIALDSATPLTPSAGARLDIGLRDTIEAEARAAARLGRGSLSVRGFIARTDGYIQTEKPRRGPIDVPLETRTRGIEAVGRLPLGDATKLTARLRLFDDRRVNGLVSAPNDTQGFDGSLRLLRDAGPDGWSFDALVYGKTRDFSSGFAAVNATRTVATPSLDQFAVPAHGIGAKLEIRPPLPPAYVLQAGLDLRTARGETRENFRYLNDRFTRLREAGGAQRSLGIFLESSARLDDRWTLAAGVRLDEWRQFDGTRIERDRDTNAPTLASVFPARSGRIATGRLGASYAITTDWSVRAFAYRGFRIPTLNELYRPFRVGNDVTEADAALAPEKLLGADLGLGWRRGDAASFDVTLFANRIDDAVANVTIGRGPGTFPLIGALPVGGVLRQRDNLGRVRVLGLEARGEWRIAASLSLDASYAFVDNRIRSAPTVSLVGKRLAQSPRHSLAAGLAYRPISTVSISLRGRYLSGQFDDDENERRLAAAFVADAAAVWRPHSAWEVSLTLQNLFDARVDTAVAGDGLRSLGAPFQMRAGVAWRL